MLQKLLKIGLTLSLFAGGISQEALSQINRQKNMYGIGDISIHKGRQYRGFFDNSLFSLHLDGELHAASKTNNTLFLGLEGIISMTPTRTDSVQATDLIGAKIGYQHLDESFAISTSVDFYPYQLNNEQKSFEINAQATYNWKALTTKIETFYNVSQQGLGVIAETSYEPPEMFSFPLTITVGGVITNNYYEEGTTPKSLYGKITVYLNEHKMMSFGTYGTIPLMNEEKPKMTNNKTNITTEKGIGIFLNYNLDARRGKEKSIPCNKKLIKNPFK